MSEKPCGFNRSSQHGECQGACRIRHARVVGCRAPFPADRASHVADMTEMPKLSITFIMLNNCETAGNTS
ncbi:hypothetical protein ACU4GI_11450, partial [Cupriavidus basilensis]